MNCIGIIGAMEIEVSALKNKMEIENIVEKASMKFYEGKLGGKKVVVVQSGIGKINAGICTQILVDLFQVDAIINTGIAGSLRNEINIGDIVISTDAVHHDVDVRVFGYPLGQVPGIDSVTFPANEALAELAERVCHEVNPDIQVFRGRVASGDQFISSKEVKARIVENFGASCVEMEGASIGHAAYLNGVPFLIIRAISDKADDSATVSYETFEKAAAEHSVRLTENMIKAL